jgi:Mg2+/Co2+ transporter CorC
LPVDHAAAALRTTWETDAATVGGLVTGALGHLPVSGETVRIGDFEIEVERVAERAVETVIARRVHGDDRQVGAD